MSNSILLVKPRRGQILHWCLLLDEMKYGIEAADTASSKGNVLLVGLSHCENAFIPSHLPHLRESWSRLCVQLIVHKKGKNIRPLSHL